MSRNVKAKKKSPTITKYKKTVWTNFSKYIRTALIKRYGNVCCSCGKPINGAAHAGHYIAKGTGVHEAVRFDQRNIGLQCYYCNMFLDGNIAHFHTWMVEKRGQHIIDDLLLLSKKKIKWNIDILKWINGVAKANLHTLEHYKPGTPLYPITWYTIERELRRLDNAE